LDERMNWKKNPVPIIALALAAGIVIGFFASRQFPVRPVTPPPAVNATEEYAAAEFQRRIDAADEALRKSLSALGAGQAQVQSVEPHKHAGRSFGFQTLRLPECDQAALRSRLDKELAELVPQARLAEHTPREWHIFIDGTQTHRLLLPQVEAKPAPQPPAAKARIALVIDDMGEDVGFAKGLAALDVPVAFSIWPDSGNRDAVIKIARARQREILIHLPMQPKGYPQVDPGRHALLTRMTAEQIQAATRRAIGLVHGAIGINNHMGSAFTEDGPAMRAALEVMKHDGLFFLDSRTTAQSVGVQEAKKLGLRHYQRDVFLDNEQDVAAILKQLRQAESVARRKGQAIAIGHPHPATLAALKQWLKARDPAVHVVPISTLAQD
jgi:polysaccharide deacetylase 2 family uncharacterized protein YibQ